jgi:methylase of polypeptide subunit release factors
MPNDEKEQERLDFQHHIYSLLLAGELYTAPIESPPKRALDVGTGTGIWAMDFADKFPDCHIVGTDLSAISANVRPSEPAI